MGMTGSWSWVLPLLLALILPVRPAFAQQVVPVHRDAERLFEEGLRAFEGGEYAMAHRLFRAAHADYALHRKTAASLLMAAKSLYRDGRYAAAAEQARLLPDDFPQSRYVEEARHLHRLATSRVDWAAAEGEVHDLGIILPLEGEHATLSQALFTGVHLAVEEHNRLHPDRPVRMVFRDTGAESSQASNVMATLAREGIDAVIGPLYSWEAVASAEAAEEAGVVLIAPLATDEAVSRGKRHVFQANPTFSMRGRLMARFARNGLRLEGFGIIAQGGGDRTSERMAEGFRDEVTYGEALSGNLRGDDAAGSDSVLYHQVLDLQTDWKDLTDVMGPSTLRLANAVYVPVSGENGIEQVHAILTRFDEMGLAQRIRVLGNTGWHLVPNLTQASRYGATYANDFYVDGEQEAVRAFAESFRAIVGESPDPATTLGRLAFTGYDVVRFLLPLMTDSSGVALADRIHEAPVHQGLGIRIDFSRGNVNEGMFYFRYQDGFRRLLR